jgi:hypothetical protein
MGCGSYGRVDRHGGRAGALREVVQHAVYAFVEDEIGQDGDAQKSSPSPSLGTILVFSVTPRNPQPGYDHRGTHQSDGALS